MLGRAGRYRDVTEVTLGPTKGQGSASLASTRSWSLDAHARLRARGRTESTNAHASSRGRLADLVEHEFVTPEPGRFEFNVGRAGGVLDVEHIASAQG